MLLGLKVMAIAQRHLYVKGNHDIFLRCDYNVIKDENTEIILILKDFVYSLPKDVQDFAINLHEYCMKIGFTCKLDIFYLGIRFIYFYKNKEVWTFSSANESGYRILINAQNIHKYTADIESFPIELKQKISRGYGCNKKLFGEQCQKGFHGFSFSLDDSIISIAPYIKEMIDKEFLCIAKKNK